MKQVIYEYTLDTMDFFYFATREIAQKASFTPAVIHNYALMYALHEKTRVTPPMNPKKKKQEPRYQELFTKQAPMYSRIYASPAVLIKETTMQTHFFNSVGEEIYYSIELDVKKNLNYPRIGYYQKLTPLAKYKGLLTSETPLPKTFILRLGKKKNPVRITLQELHGKTVTVPQDNPVPIEHPINPKDKTSIKNMPLYNFEEAETQIQKADLVVIPPSPLLTNIWASGKLYQVNNKYYLLPKTLIP